MSLDLVSERLAHAYIPVSVALASVSLADVQAVVQIGAGLAAIACGTYGALWYRTQIRSKRRRERED